jgi:hypothetical protein
MKPIYLKQNQSVLFVPVKPQPVYIESSGRWLWPKNNAVTGSREWWHYMNSLSYAPYRPGEECYVREALHKGINISSSEYCSIHYPDDTPVLFKDGAFMGMFGRAIWQWGGLRLPIIAMPQWASRRHVRIVSCEPIRVEYVTEEDAKRMGVEQLLEPGTWKDYGDPDSICLGATGSFLSLWHKKHPGKQWAWRVITKEAPLS